MKTAIASLFLAATLAGDAFARNLQDVPEVGVGPVIPVGNTTSTFTTSTDETTTTTVEADLVEALEEDEQVTVVGVVELGELLCESLTQAEDAAALSFNITSNETIIAEQSSYTITPGDAFTDGIGRKVWTGIVTDPEQGDDEAVPRTVSMTWGEVCDVETFLLKVIKRNLDDTTTMIKTVPCDIGSDTDICLVEVLVEFQEPGPVLVPDGLVVSNVTISSSSNTADPGRRLGAPNTFFAGRNLQDSGDTIINVMVLYSNQAREMLGSITDDQMETTILESLAWTNQAMINSLVPVFFNPVHIGLLPYDEQSTDGIETLTELRTSAEVIALRDVYEADLVQLVGYFDDGFCGWGYFFYDNADYGFTLVKATCLDNYIHTQEYGHNLGCQHNRENSAWLTEYSHGERYCDGIAPYRTIMSLPCGSPYANYFSNPDVTYLGRATGTPTEDNARTIKDNMVAVSNYRASPTPSPPPTATSPTAMPPTVTFPPVTPPTVTTPPTTAPPTTAPPATSPPTTAPPTTVTPTTAPPTTAPPTTAPPTTTIPTYEYIGCYADSTSDRVPPGTFVMVNHDMTTDLCAIFCEGSTYFGTAFSIECFCGHSSDDPTDPWPGTCDFPCAGNADQICGGVGAISVYQYTAAYTALGCFVDDKDNRVLSGESATKDPTMTTEVCAALCGSEATYFGTEFGRECYCGLETDNPSELGEGICNYDCAGDPTQTCGGYNAISVYVLGSVTPGASYVGCYTDRQDDRIMELERSGSGMTNEICEDECTGSTFFGTQYGRECWCGDASTDYASHGVSSACVFECGGDAAQNCGGFNAMSVWQY